MEMWKTKRKIGGKVKDVSRGMNRQRRGIVESEKERGKEGVEKLREKVRMRRDNKARKNKR